MTASWVVVSRATGKPVLETFERRVADAINLEKYEALPIGKWLARLNDQIRHEAAAAARGAG